ncbi:MAG: hypothetical protein AVDCRST_MAG18-4482 [uncultured Thermomicrobiales bacterium]|uniref:Uncharacterized protein n=1 Tax=uncultured Thermomicrobiales bacterium TaxID=1645740 RepID=A0A6J4VYX4_9BACT|nr:MAG: hypothetical protein AVDCRST_MAG18-4482 [uncultured Thermomicrobiales bacterium]
MDLTIRLSRGLLAPARRDTSDDAKGGHEPAGKDGPRDRPRPP